MVSASHSDTVEKITDNRLEHADPAEKPAIDNAYKNEVGYKEYIEG